MGCFRTIGCLVVLVIAGAAAWIFRDHIPWLKHREARVVAPSAMTTVWEPLTAEGATRARAAVQRFEQKGGPSFANLRPGDLSAYVFEELSKQLPPSTQNAEAAVIGDKLYVRGNVKLADFGGQKALGPLAGMFGDREPVQFGGTLDVVRPGLAEYRVTNLQIKDLKIPSPMIPKLVRQIEHGPRPTGLADDGLPLVIPKSIADVRIAGGHVTLYKNTP